MLRTLRRVTALGAAGVVLSILVTPMAQAQDPTDDACRSYGLAPSLDGGCVYPIVPTSEVPLVRAPFPDGDWSTVEDPSGDVRSPDGDLFQRPEADIAQVWWRVGKLPRATVRALNDLEGIKANDTQLNTRDRYFQLVIRPVGDMLGSEPEKQTLLLGIGTDQNGKPANDASATTGSPFSFWTGVDATNQAGQFSNGVFGAVPTKLNGKGEFVEYYNTDSGIWMGIEPDAGSYTLLIPRGNVGNVFRVFTQTVDGETALADLVGSPLAANGFLSLDGIAGPATGCVELLQVNPSGVGDGTAPAALQVRFGGPPQDVPLTLTLDLFRGNDEISLDPILGVPDGEGIKFDVSLPRDGTYRVGGFQLLGDLDGDGTPEELPAGTWDARHAARLAHKIDLTGDGRGHLLGALNCARDRFWMGTANACERIGSPPDPWTARAGERRYELEDALAATFGVEDAILTSGGDDQIASCSVTDGGGQPVFGISWFRHPVSAEQAAEIAQGLERADCIVNSQLTTANSAVLQWQRSCTGEQPSESVFVTDRESGSSFFAQTPREDQGFFGRSDDFVLRFHQVDSDFDGISDAEDDDIDNDGVPNDKDIDWDNDGIPNRQDRQPLNAHVS